MTKQTLSPLERELDARQDAIRQLQIALDDAAEGNDTESIKALQADLAAAEVMLASTLRRIERAKQGASEAERAAKREAIEKARATVAAAVQTDAKAAEQVAKALAQLALAVKAMTGGAHVNAARQAVQTLMAEFSREKRMDLAPIAHNISHDDGQATSLVVDYVRALAVPAQAARKHAAPDVVAVYTERAERMGKVVERMANSALESVK